MGNTQVFFFKVALFCDNMHIRNSLNLLQLLCSLFGAFWFMIDAWLPLATGFTVVEIGI
jgi:hypothetical protein